MRKSLTALIPAAAVAAAVTLASAPASASGDVPGLRIGRIGYNAFGPDTPENRNQEWVEIVNHSGEAVDIKGLLIQDAWARGNNRTRGCNTVRIESIPAEGGGTTTQLPAGHTIRVHMGEGTPRVVGTTHLVYRDMPTRCGFNGHVLNNKPTAGANLRAPWDTVWITHGGASEGKSYNFSSGYVAS